MIQLISLLSLLTLVNAVTWDTIYSVNTSYIKLTNGDILPLSTYNFTGEEPLSTVITPPTQQNYSLSLANSNLYAVYSQESTIAIAKLNTTSFGWTTVHYDTTLSNGLQYYQDSTVMTSLIDETEMIYIYGGIYNNSISNRLLEYNPIKNTLNQITTSVSPTGFYGASNAILDPQGTINIVIGGKSTSGWISMFQIALWEYKAWTFKSVQTQTFAVNSRIDPLVLPVFSGNEVDSVIVLGGSLNDELSSPYVLNLKITGNWEWTDLTASGDFNVADSIGAIVINRTLVSITGQSNKRDGAYSYRLYDVNSMKATKTINQQILPGSTSSMVGLATDSSKPKTTSNARSDQKTKITILATLVPLISLTLISVSGYLIYKKYSSPIAMDESDSESTGSRNTITEDYYKALNNIDNQSITSWSYKRDEFESKRMSSQSAKTIIDSPNALPKLYSNSTKPGDFSFERQNTMQKLKNIYRPTLKLRKSMTAFDDDDLKDLTTANRSSQSLLDDLSTINQSSEELKIDEFLQDRDVQVLVSSKRRSVLRITNPDIDVDAIEDPRHTDSTDTESTHSSDVQTMYLSDVGIIDDEKTNAEYFNDILRRFEEERD